jgi:hypothetical protein
MRDETGDVVKFVNFLEPTSHPWLRCERMGKRKVNEFHNVPYPPLALSNPI